MSEKTTSDAKIAEDKLKRSYFPTTLTRHNNTISSANALKNAADSACSDVFYKFFDEFKQLYPDSQLSINDFVKILSSIDEFNVGGRRKHKRKKIKTHRRKSKKHRRKSRRHRH